MGGVNETRQPRLVPVSEEARVMPIELFFDLVFVERIRHEEQPVKVQSD